MHADALAVGLLAEEDSVVATAVAEQEADVFVVGEVAEESGELVGFGRTAVAVAVVVEVADEDLDLQ